MASETMSTKITSGGQTTVPKDVRDLLGLVDGARVYWIVDKGRVYISETPAIPLEVSSCSDLKRRLDEAEVDLVAGRVQDARDLSAGIRGRYHA